MTPLEIPAARDFCGKSFMMYHALSFPKRGVFLGMKMLPKNGGPQGPAPDPSAISYESQINRRSDQGERPGVGVRREGEAGSIGISEVDTKRG